MSVSKATSSTGAAHLGISSLLKEIVDGLCTVADIANDFVQVGMRVVVSGRDRLDLGVVTTIGGIGEGARGEELRISHSLQGERSNVRVT